MFEGLSVVERIEDEMETLDGGRTVHTITFILQ